MSRREVASKMSKSASPCVRQDKSPLETMRQELRLARANFSQALLQHRSSVSSDVVFASKDGICQQSSGAGDDKELQALDEVVTEGKFTAAVNTQLEIEETLVQRMSERTGFGAEECRCALQQTHGNCKTAIQLLLDLDGGRM